MIFNPSIWGPYIWFTIDTICLSYPEKPTKKEKKNYKNFFYSFRYILPCDICKKHFKKYIKKNPINDEILSSKNNLIKWNINLQNNINYNQTTYDEYYKYYKSIYK